MKRFETVAVSNLGQMTLPKWWRNASGLSQGGVVEVRSVRDGKNSIILTATTKKRRGAIGLLKQLTFCPFPMPTPERHVV